METKKRILFVCATGVATSTVVEEKVIEYLRDQGIDFDFDQTNVASIPGWDKPYDLIVATCQVPGDVKAPVINGLPVLMGFGADNVYRQVVEALEA